MKTFSIACAVFLLAVNIEAKWNKPPSKSINRGSATEKCTYLLGVDNGYITYADQIKKNHFGKEVRYYCDKEYDLVGNKIRTCDPDTGVWTGTVPKCVYNRCPDVFQGLQHGQISAYSNKRQGQAVFECDDGYYLEGSVTATCMDDLTWSSTQPKCIENRCPPITTFDHGRIKNYDDKMGAWIKVECDKNYAPQGGSTNIKCEGDGKSAPKWSDSLPTCVCTDLALCGKGGCSSIVSIPNGEFELKYGSGRDYDSKIRFRCNQGWIFQELLDENPGAEKVTKNAAIDIYCTKSGWSKPVPTCKDMHCPKWEILPHGKIHNAANNYFGGTIKARCDPSWVQDGASAIKCMANGQWNNDTSCKQFKCTEWPGVNNGWLRKYSNINSFYGGTRWYLECDAGFTRVGLKTNKCMIDGKWESDSIGRCVAGFATCVASGDPHYTTFDGLNFSYQGDCLYLLSSTCGKAAANGLNEYAVYGKNRAAIEDGKKVSYTDYIMVDMYGYRFKLAPQSTGSVVTMAKLKPQGGKMVPTNWVALNLPVLGVPSGFANTVAKGSGLTIQKAGIWLELRNEEAFVARINDYAKADITVPAAYNGIGLCGICANFDNMPGNDAVTKSGKSVAKTVKDEVTGAETTTFEWFKIGNSWEVAGPESPDNCTVEEDIVPTCDNKDDIEKLCKPIKDKDGIFSACISKFGGRQAEQFYTECVFDGCEDESNVCNTISLMAEFCAENGITVSWRSTDYCPLPCRENFEYHVATTACPESCTYKPEKCSEPDVEGCACKAGYVLSNDECIKKEECGCTDDLNRYFPLGDSYISANCTQKKTCNGEGTFDTETLPACHMHAYCGFVDDERKCICKDGYTGDGIVDCSMPSTTPAPTTTTTSKPVGSMATCVTAGDPFYTSFDNARIEFQGTKEYILAKECVNSDWIVKVENKATKDNRAYARRFTLEVAGHVITLEEFGKIKVDGTVRESFELKSAGLTVVKMGTAAVIKATKIGIELSFDGRGNMGRHVSHLKVTDKALSGKLCGLCGNWNGKAQDDLYAKDRPDEVVSATVLGNSWEVKSQNL